jgi:ureidoglycolate lyase
MKLASFRKNDGIAVGIVVGDRLVDLSVAAPSLPRTMEGLIAAWDERSDEVKQAASGAATLALADVELVSPVPAPRKILAIGLNYADHIAESGQPTPAEQVWFAKTSNTVHGPFAPIQLPKVSPFLDYEAELVVVIGKRCKHVSREDAPGVVFGYMVGNDVTVRDWQFRTPQWILGKSFDTHAPMGPWVVTADELGDPHTLGIRCFVNGDKRQDSNTSNLVFNVWDQVAHLSQAMTLEPGDVIFTGTPGGIGAAMDPRCFLVAGDVVRVEIDRVGAIEATVVAE